MSDTNVLVLVALISLTSSIGVQFVGAYFKRAQTGAETGKIRAETNTLSSTEWRGLYGEAKISIDKVEERVLVLEQELDTARVKIATLGLELIEAKAELRRLRLQLELANDRIQYLWLGTLDNIKHMKAHGITPPFEPVLNFRGDDDFDSSEWAWLEGDK